MSGSEFCLNALHADDPTHIPANGVTLVHCSLGGNDMQRYAALCQQRQRRSRRSIKQVNMDVNNAEFKIHTM